MASNDEGLNCAVHVVARMRVHLRAGSPYGLPACWSGLAALSRHGLRAASSGAFPPGAPSRGAGKAAASSRDALRVRRASVVTTAKLGSDDALRQHRYVEETRYLRGFSRIGLGQSKSAGKCRRAKERFFDPGSRPFYPSVSASWQQDRTEALSGKDLSFRASRPGRIKAV